MIPRIERLLIALVFALFAAGVTLVIASAKDEKASTPAQFTTDCATCHSEAKVTWENGAHGKTGVMTCETCHGSASTEHPKMPMTINRSPDLCIGCHSDSQFGVEDWNASKHNQLGMDCATCHDPHGATLKNAEGSTGAELTTDDISLLCINCHKEHSMTFSYTSHNQKGVTCVDCHVKHFGDATANSVPDHSFNASLDSCNTCHGEQMHSTAEALEGESTPLTAGAEAPSTVVTPEPEAVSPVGFSAMAGMVGLAGGMVLAPWLERWFRRSVRQNKEEDHE
jgi:predicted CXXCH cytochrome family protein